MKGSTVALLLGGVAAAGAAAWFLLRQPSTTSAASVGVDPAKPINPKAALFMAGAGVGAGIVKEGAPLVAAGVRSIASGGVGGVGDRASSYAATAGKLAIQSTVAIPVVTTKAAIGAAKGAAQATVSATASAFKSIASIF